MIRNYHPKAIREKWQAFWLERKTFKTPNPGEPGFDPARPKFYVLDMFPYPSGSGLHVGHPEGYTATDIIARYRRMKGFNVLHPMGWDAFGLPAEQHAIETGTHPAVTTHKNIATFRRQLQTLGFSYDWDREISTTDVGYYRWTQWIFLQIFNAWYDDASNRAHPISDLPIPADTRAQGDRAIREYVDSKRLAYLAEVPVNWCPALGTVLSNEEVTNEGRSDRGNHPVFRRPMKQWMLRITKYADRLLEDLEPLDWPESVKLMQRNWIGRSEGAQVRFALAPHSDSDPSRAPDQSRDRKGAPSALSNSAPPANNRHATPGVSPPSSDQSRAPDQSRAREEAVPPSADIIEIFTTRPDTLFGATYMVLAPEHPLVEKITTPAQREAVRAYCAAAAQKSDLARTADSKEKTGVPTGAFAINPVNNARIPIWVADYVLTGYGTGAIMAVPGEDQRDWDFAKKFDLPIIRTVKPPHHFDGEAFLGEGPAINSDFLNGLSVDAAQIKITAWLEERGLGTAIVNYKLRDWLFSRQRYWGEPFPILHGPDGEILPLDESELPLTLPEMTDFRPTIAASGETATNDALPEPPLGRAKDWALVRRDGKTYRRELNTMPQWAGSCWYYLRFLDPTNDQRFCSREAEQYWMVSRKKDGTPHVGSIDLYLGGAEHAVLHLLYARFWHKLLFDLGHLSTREPFGKLFNQGMIRAFAYRDARGVYRGYDEIEFRDDGGAQLKATGEKLSGNVEKMSKSMKNVINPDEVVRDYGADSLRLYEMFMGPLDAGKPWNPRDVPGVFRFLQRTWRLLINEDTGELAASVSGEPASSATRTDQSRDRKGAPGDSATTSAPPHSSAPPDNLERLLHKTIKKVGEDIDRLAFNTAISAMMEFVNEAYRAKSLRLDQAERFVTILSPFAPFIAEELWQKLRGPAWTDSISRQPWPAFDPAFVVDDEIEIPIQINGKLITRLTVRKDANEAAIRSAALADEKVRARLGESTVSKTIFVPGRMMNLVLR